MTFTRRTLATSAACALFAVAVSAQVAVQPHGQEYVGPAHAVRHIDATARIDLLDERIAMLTADLRMFVGELKIQAMADLIEALVERQALIDAEMRRIHEHMRGPTNDRRRHLPPASELAPDTLCSPFI
jgi:hypothetical protein